MLSYVKSWMNPAKQSHFNETGFARDSKRIRDESDLHVTLLSDTLSKMMNSWRESLPAPAVERRVLKLETH